MKRMYVVLSVIILFSLWMLQALGQKVMGPSTESRSSAEEQFRRRMELREQTHKRMRDKLIYGIGPDQDLFQGLDEMMDVGVSPTMKMDWSETKEGRSLVIVPEDPAQKIDLDVKGEMITIKGETKVESESGSSMSSFSNSFPVPQDCDASKVKITNEKGKIVLSFPFRGTRKPKDTRVPVPPTGEEITI